MKESVRALDVANIRAIAEAELKNEIFRNAVEEMKQKLRRVRWYHRLFPWRVVILRRDV